PPVLLDLESGGAVPQCPPFSASAHPSAPRPDAHDVRRPRHRPHRQRFPPPRGLAAFLAVRRSRIGPSLDRRQRLPEYSSLRLIWCLKDWKTSVHTELSGRGRSDVHAAADGVCALAHAKHPMALGDVQILVYSVDDPDLKVGGIYGQHHAHRRLGRMTTRVTQRLLDNPVGG